MLTKTVIKLFPTPNKIGMRLVIKDDDIEVFNKTYWEQFSPGDGATNKIKQEIGRDMQADINEYKKLKDVYDSNAFDTAVTQVETGLVI